MKFTVKCLLTISLFFVLNHLFFFWVGDIGGGYSLKGYDSTNWHITRRGELVIGTSVIDVDISSNYIIGLRLPSGNNICVTGTNGKHLYNDMGGNKEFFLIDTMSDQIVIFNDRDEFERNLSKRGIDLSLVKVEYERFDQVLSANRARFRGNSMMSCSRVDINDSF